ncbi:MAG: 30S ribosomal protein S16 [Parcubacteria group bacterium GW2011_GWC2_44_22]|nr:MAG: 30S ribosomal protein S16 [Parcubacteria group bacterium GW2011_GWC2_44_22]
MGRKNLPFYRLLLIEAARSRDGKFVEELGHFNPRDKDKSLTLREERIKYWLKEGAEASATVHNMLVSRKLVTGPKQKATKVHRVETEKSASAAKAIETAPAA